MDNNTIIRTAELLSANDANANADALTAIRAFTEKYGFTPAELSRTASGTFIVRHALGQRECTHIDMRAESDANVFTNFYSL